MSGLLGLNGGTLLGGSGGGGGPGGGGGSYALLCHFDGADGATSSTDSSSHGHTLTFGGAAQLDTAQSVFGGASLLLDEGAGDERDHERSRSVPGGRCRQERIGQSTPAP